MYLLKFDNKLLRNKLESLINYLKKITLYYRNLDYLNIVYRTCYPI